MLVVNGLRASGAVLGTPAVTTAVSLAKEIVRPASPRRDSTASHSEALGTAYEPFATKAPDGSDDLDVGIVRGLGFAAAAIYDRSAANMLLMVLKSRASSSSA